MMRFYQSVIDLQNEPVGTERFFSAAVIDDPFWTLQVRSLESNGISVAVQPLQNPQQRLFVAETSDQNLLGFDLNSTTIKQIVCTNIGVSHRSQASQTPKLQQPGLHFVPHHTMILFICDDTSMGSYEGPLFLPSSQISLFLADNTAVQYGQSGFDGISVIKQNNTLRVFRVDACVKRLVKTAQALSLPVLDTSVARQAILDLVRTNASYVPTDGKLYIRPYVMGTSGGFGASPAQQSIIGFEVCAFNNFYAKDLQLIGLLDLNRPLTGADKVSANYADTFRRKKNVQQRGYDDYVSFNGHGNIEEVSKCAIGFIKQGDEVEYHFPHVREDAPAGSNLQHYRSLDSITRRSIITLLKKLGKTVVIHDIHHSSLNEYDGMFTMGNAAGIMSVKSLDIGTSNTNAIIKKIQFKKNSVPVIHQLQGLFHQARTGYLSDNRLIDLNQKWVDVL